MDDVVQTAEGLHPHGAVLKLQHLIEVFLAADHGLDLFGYAEQITRGLDNAGLEVWTVRLVVEDAVQSFVRQAGPDNVKLPAADVREKNASDAAQHREEV